MIIGVRLWLALFSGAGVVGIALAQTSLPTIEQSAETPPLATAPLCPFDEMRGREFQFATADPVLQSNGYVLWKSAPTLLSEPLPYAEYHGRRGKLTGEVLVNQGMQWFEGFLDDCSPVFAEDASAFSDFPGIRHLELNGKVIFRDMLAAARSLVDQELVVQGGGLEPRQRLYTAVRNRAFGLRGGEHFTVVGVDLHRYAHAKGVGPFFLVVERDDGQQGLIKFNPEYLRPPDNALPMRALRLLVPEHVPPSFAVPEALPVLTLAPPRALGSSGEPALETALLAAPVLVPEEPDVVLQVATMDDAIDAEIAAHDLREAGYEAEIVPGTEGSGARFQVLVTGLPTQDAAEAAVVALSQRFGWEPIILAR